MENRYTLKFKWPTASLEQASYDKLNFHQERLDFWRTKRDEKLEEIKEGGLKVNDRISRDYLESITSNAIYKGPGISIDEKLEQDLKEAITKVNEHSKKVQEYTAWYDIFRSEDIAKNFEITYEDYCFFFTLNNNKEQNNWIY